MSSLTGAQLFFQRYQRAKARAMLWAPILEASFYYSVPFRDRFYRQTQVQGELTNRRLYDLTGVEATKTFVSKLHDTMTPPQVQWGFLELDTEGEDFEDEFISEANQALNAYMRKLFKYIHESNFDIIVGEAYFDLAIGTACLVSNFHTLEEPLLYTSIPIDQLAIEEALDGRVKTWFRTWHDIKINEITMKWPNAVLTPSLKQQLSENIDATVKEFIEGVTYNPHDDMPYSYCLYSLGDNQAVLEEKRKTNPGIVWRFQKTNNEWWGRGPVMEALPAMMRANEMAKIEFASANLNTFRPYMGFSDGIFNPFTFELKPMTVIPIAQVGRDGQLPLIPLPDSSNPQFAQMTILDLRNQINNLLFADPLGPVEGPAKTATELALRQQNLAQKIGPLFTRLQQEFLWPVIDNAMYILDNSGILPKPKLKGLELKFKYKSPLALSKGQQDMAVLTQYIQLMQGIFGPEVTQLMLNQEKTPYVLAQMLQVDERFLNSPEQLKVAAQKLQKEKVRQEMVLDEQNQNGGQPLGV
jgi:hypothetical protein